MDQIPAEHLDRYFKIYEQIYDNPFISIREIAQNTKIAKRIISRDLTKMNRNFMYGPIICLKSVKNCHQYTHFLKVDSPLSAYQHCKGVPSMVYTCLAFGSWNLFLVSRKDIDFSFLEGFREYIVRGVKGGTYLSKVKTVDWNESLEKMYSMLETPKEKSYLYEEVPEILWGKKEWMLYHAFKYNVRIPVTPILEKLGIHHEQYKKWLHSLSVYARIQVSFHPRGWGTYSESDLLFKSDYQRQIADVLGQLPSTSFFSSVGEYLLARVSVTNRREREELITLIYEMGERGYFTDFYHALVIFVTHNNLSTGGTAEE